MRSFCRRLLTLSKAADFLANVNVGFKERRKVVFCSNTMPRKLIGIIRIDRAGISDTRILKM